MAPQLPDSGHAVLLGDSIFDNQAYVGSDPDVATQLRSELPDAWTTTLLAVDGDTCSGVVRQLAMLPPGATHLVVSAGGNDALGYVGLLEHPCSSVAEGIGMLAQAQAGFAAAYEAMLDAVTASGLPVAACTIYDTPTSAPNHTVIKAALGLFNDRITRAAFARGLAVIDLRVICNEDADYANPIEPSSAGGRKIAASIVSFLRPETTAVRSGVVAGAGVALTAGSGTSAG